MPLHLDTLAEECRRISSVVESLVEEDFDRPTRLPAWTIRELLAHLWIEVRAISECLDRLPPAQATIDAIDYWRSYDPDAEGGPIADEAKELAASVGSAAELAAGWGETWRRAVQVATMHDGNRPVFEDGLALTLNDFLITRVIEATVHGLDLARALGLPPWATVNGLADTVATLEGLLGIRAPSALAWGEVSFVEKGTGRQPLTASEQVILGELTGRFPLLR
jgi:uncharacterized protein (TIGR03083 family)